MVVRRRRGDRHRVRLDVRRPRHAGHRRGEAAAMLEFCDPEVVESLKFHLRDQAVTFRFGEEVGEGRAARARHGHAAWRAASGSPADTVMYSAGRQGSPTSSSWRRRAWRPTRAAGSRSTSTTGPRSPHIYAVGDVIGFPALAATSMDQGRLAAYHAFGEPARELQSLQPIGIYTIPEISYCGQHRGGADDGGGAVRGRHLALPRAGPRRRSSATRTGCSSCWSHTEDRTPARACTSSAPTPPTWSTSARRSWAAAAPWTTSSTRCSTTRRCPRRTRSPRWTRRTRSVRLDMFANGASGEPTTSDEQPAHEAV